MHALMTDLDGTTRQSSSSRELDRTCMYCTYIARWRTTIHCFAFSNFVEKIVICQFSAKIDVWEIESAADLLFGRMAARERDYTVVLRRTVGLASRLYIYGPTIVVLVWES